MTIDADCSIPPASCRSHCFFLTIRYSILNILKLLKTKIAELFQAPPHHSIPTSIYPAIRRSIYGCNYADIFSAFSSSCTRSYSAFICS